MIDDRELEQALQNKTILASNLHEDGRVASIFDENNIKEALLSLYRDRVKIPEKRKWYDVLLDGEPYNIKSTTGTSADNMGSYLPLRYAFTKEEALVEKSARKTNDIVPLLSLLENLKKGLTIEDTGRDYRFIVYNKNTKNFIVRPLKKLKVVRSNPSNLPFQIKWNENIEEGELTATEAFTKFVVEPLYCVGRSFEVTLWKHLKSLN